MIVTSMGEITVELFAEETPVAVGNFLGLAEGTRPFIHAATKKEIRAPFYDNSDFHRVIANFMIQGGRYRAGEQEGPGYAFADEMNAKSLGLDKIHPYRNGVVHKWIKNLPNYRDEFVRMITNPTLKKLGILNDFAAYQSRKDEIEKAYDDLTFQGAYENIGYSYIDDRPSHPNERGTLVMANAGPNTNGSQFFINLVDNPQINGKYTVFGRVIAGMEIADAIGKVEVGANWQPVAPVHILTIRRVAR
jgi:peptidyl-prolyl cis-trans isomerase A (cyclophilin A)